MQKSDWKWSLGSFLRARSPSLHKRCGVWEACLVEKYLMIMWNCFGEFKVQVLDMDMVDERFSCG